MNILWTEKHKPDNFDNLTHNASVNQTLQNLVSQGDLPHLIIYGPDGSGKRTRINCLLVKLYGKACLKTTRSTYTTKNNATLIEIQIKSSKNHIELMPSEAGHNDVFVLTKLMKETATSALTTDVKNGFLTFVIYDGEFLTLKAQASLRRTMEKYSSKIRLIFVCSSIGSLIPAIKSRCLVIRNPAPSEKEILSILKNIVKREGQTTINETNLEQVVSHNNRNIRKAILTLQTCIASKSFAEEILQDHWKTVIEKEICDKAIQERTVETIRKTRNVFYDLISCQIPSDLIIVEILNQILLRLDNSLKCDNKAELQMALKEAAVGCEKQLKQGDRDIMFLEGFLVKVLMNIEKHKGI